MKYSSEELGFVVNPAAGGCAGKQLAEKLKQHCPNVLLLDPATFKHDFLNLAKNVKRVVIAGGDGAFSFAASEIFNNNLDVSLGVLPMGTGNDMARVLNTNVSYWGIPPRSIVRMFLNLGTEELDVWKAGEFLFTNYFSFGVDAMITYDFEMERKRNNLLVGSSKFANWLVYAELARRRIFRKVKRTIKIKWQTPNGDENEQVISGTLKTLLFLNIPSYAAGSRPGGVKKSDGLIDIYLSGSLLDFLRLLLARYGLPGPDAFARARTVELKISRAIPAQYDGEALEKIDGEVLINLAGKIKVLAKRN